MVDGPSELECTEELWAWAKAAVIKAATAAAVGKVTKPIRIRYAFRRAKPSPEISWTKFRLVVLKE